MVTELQVQLLVREKELDSWENALMAREDDLAATERALGKACMECDAKCDRAEAVQQDYRAKMRATTASSWHSLDFDRVLRGCQFILTMWGTDL
jgi:hypothetical protein